MLISFMAAFVYDVYWRIPSLLLLWFFTAASILCKGSLLIVEKKLLSAGGWQDGWARFTEGHCIAAHEKLQTLSMLPFNSKLLVFKKQNLMSIKRWYQKTSSHLRQNRFLRWIFFSLCRQRLRIWVHLLWLTTSTTTASSVFLGWELLSVFLGMNDKLWRKNESAASSSSWMRSAIKAQPWGRECCSVGACLFCAKAGMADSHQASRVWRDPGRFLIESSCCLVEDLDESPGVTAH